MKEDIDPTSFALVRVVIDQNKRYLASGFTLIELLVVIAIIGILSTIVLGSLDTARGKGSDAATKSNLDNTRTQAEIYYDSQVPTNIYTGVCTSIGLGGISNMIIGAKSSSGATNINTTYATGGSSNTVTCHDSANNYAAEAPLKDGTHFWCVDSTGTSTSHLNHISGSAVVCTAG